MFLANILGAGGLRHAVSIVDRDDDVKIGVKSRRRLDHYYDALVIGILQVNVLALMAIVG